MDSKGRGDLTKNGADGVRNLLHGSAAFVILFARIIRRAGNSAGRNVLLRLGLDTHIAARFDSRFSACQRAHILQRDRHGKIAAGNATILPTLICCRADVHIADGAQGYIVCSFQHRIFRLDAHGVEHSGNRQRNGKLACARRGINTHFTRGESTNPVPGLDAAVQTHARVFHNHGNSQRDRRIAIVGLDLCLRGGIHLDSAARKDAARYIDLRRADLDIDHVQAVAQRLVQPIGDRIQIEHTADLLHIGGEVHIARRDQLRSLLHSDLRRMVYVEKPGSNLARLIRKPLKRVLQEIAVSRFGVRVRHALRSGRVVLRSDKDVFTRHLAG